MSDSAFVTKNCGAYSSPFCGVGVEFFPLGVSFDLSGFVLHEVGYLARNNRWNFPNVLSPFWRLYYNFCPGHTIVFPHREVELRPEYLVLIPEHQLFHCRGTIAVPHLFLAFSVLRRLTPEQPLPILLRPLAIEQQLIESMPPQFEPVPQRERIFHMGLAILNLVLSRPEIVWQQRAPAAVQETIRFIAENYALRLTIPRLAQMADLSVEAFARSFKEYQGETIGQHILKVRVREAAHLLTHGDATIDAIAEQTGLSNRAYLSRVFKRITGDSPARFRRRHRVDVAN
ncbi:MAG: helix-turn-helix transcriptional regulator [Pirellulales bacterium]|nr:helix-turn-helix transcriptional regulator [Pirellulales bacterium]